MTNISLTCKEHYLPDTNYSFGDRKECINDNGESTDDHSQRAQKQTRYVVLSLCSAALCCAALLLNALVLVTMCWMRRRRCTRTLCLSVSLAAADASSSLCMGIGIIINSLLEHGLDVKLSKCVQLALEAMRLGAIVSAELHLLALALHHLLGIERPLQYPGNGRRRACAAALAAMWLLPTAFFATYFSALPGEGFQVPDCSFGFILHFKHRAIISSIVGVPVVAMFCIYCRIFAVVRRLDAARPRCHDRTPIAPSCTPAHGPATPSAPSLRCKPPSLRSVTSMRSNGCASGRATRPLDGAARTSQQRVARHVKAALTTLLIVGSCVMGWAPVITVFVLICDDCPFNLNRESVGMFYVYNTCNLLLILKTFFNPIIYALRMPEIQEALLRMWRACCGGGGAAGASVGLSGRRRGSPGSSSAGGGGGGGGQGTARAAAAGLTRAGTVVGYLRSSPLADSGGRLNGGGGSADTSPQPLVLMPRSSGLRARQLIAQTEHL